MNTTPHPSKTNLFYEAVEREKPVGKLFVKWCWPAFFLGFVWLAYRKRLKLAIVLMVFQALTDLLLLDPFLKDHKGQFYKITGEILTGLPLSIFLGMFGVSLYMKAWAKKPQPHDRYEKYVIGSIKFLTYTIYLWILLCAYAFVRKFFANNFL